MHKNNHLRFDAKLLSYLNNYYHAPALCMVKKRCQVRIYLENQQCRMAHNRRAKQPTGLGKLNIHGLMKIAAAADGLQNFEEKLLCGFRLMKKQLLLAVAERHNGGLNG